MLMHARTLTHKHTCAYMNTYADTYTCACILCTCTHKAHMCMTNQSYTHSWGKNAKIKVSISLLHSELFCPESAHHTQESGNLLRSRASKGDV